MQKAWTPPLRLVLLVATLLGLFSTAQAYRLTALNMRTPGEIYVGTLLTLNLALWYVPAALTIPIFWLAHRFRLDSPRWLRAIAMHAAAAGAFSIVQTACMIGVRAVVLPGGGKLATTPWTAYAQRFFLSDLDWALMTYCAIVGLSYALAYYRESQDRALKAAHLEMRLVEARLKTLEAELHPHFLFNTLHAISTLVFTNPEAADRMISRLSDLLRLTFDRSGAPAVSLQEELAFLEKYLEIEQIRFQDRLSVRFDVDPEMLDAEVPRLILQPLVENAIKHGVSPSSEKGLIQISARRAGGALEIEVRDNGLGLNGQARARFSKGVGLSNTRARLECLYGDAHSLDFSEGHGGLAVKMQIPLAGAAQPAAASPATQVA
jgi:two-component system, LytTR family, sensor kinase